MADALCARDLMTKTDQTVSLDTTVSELAQKLKMLRISGVPVLGANHKICGIVSIADVFDTVFRVRDMHHEKKGWFTLFKKSPVTLKVKDIYRSSFPVVHLNTPVSELIDLAIAQNLFAIPVMSEDRSEFYGMIGRHDITAAVFSV